MPENAIDRAVERVVSRAVVPQHLYCFGLDGTGVNAGFITTSSSPLALAVDRRYVYWSTGTSIARANIDGSGVVMQFMTGGRYDSLAVDDRYIYWYDPF